MKRSIFVTVILLTLSLLACGTGTEEPVSEKFDYYSWETPGGTTINFQTQNFSGEFYPDRIDSVLGQMCTKALVVDEVNVYITDAQGYIENQPVNYEAGYGVTETIRENGLITEINVYVAGGGFKILKPYGTYTYPARSGGVNTSAVADLSGTIVEEVGVHVCRRTTNDQNPQSEDLESENVHREFLLKPTIIFKPNW